MSEVFEPLSDAERLLPSTAVPELTVERMAEDRARLIAQVAADVPTGAVAGSVVPITAARRDARGRRRRVMGAVLAGFVLTAAGGGLAAAFLGRAAPSEEVVVRCFAVATTAFDDESLFLDAGVGSPPGGPAVSAAQAALAVCGGMWSRGEVLAHPPYKPTVPPDPETAPQGEVPALHACVLPAGYVGVFPGRAGTCGALGLPESSISGG